MTYLLNEAKMFADITGGLAIIINSETGVYYGMNPFTSSIFENMINGAPLEAIIENVKTMDGAPADFADKLNTFANELLAKELIVEGEGNSEANVDAALAKECEFAISWDEFKDAQELLLADPIHEVREEEGWTPDASSLNTDKDDVTRREAKMK